MTLVSLIALAFGMMAAAADAAVPRPAFASIRLERRSRAIRRAVASGSPRTQPRERLSKPRFMAAPCRRIIAPLSGAASPRAPAAHC
jgi:hypothetical protein